MKNLFFAIATLAVLASLTESAFAVRYVNGYTKSNGSYVSGHYRDTSNDGNSWNNANELGYNN